MQFKNINRIEKFKNIQEPMVEKHTFSRTIQEHSRTFKDFKDQWPPRSVFFEVPSPNQPGCTVLNET